MVPEQDARGAGTSDLQDVLGALGSPVRREILRLIWDEELPAGEIAAAFALTKPTISQHLSVMRRAGLVTMTATGTYRRYRARQEVLREVGAGLASTVKWEVADDIPERQFSVATTKWAVVAGVDVETDQATTFTAFADPVIYSRWLGVPVTIDNGRFACTLEWGTRVRGRYELVCPPELIVMRWDFDDDNVPVPGGEMTGYLRLVPAGPAPAAGGTGGTGGTGARAAGTGARTSGQTPPAGGCHVEVHQLVDTPEQAKFMESAWGMVLGRLKAGVVEASGPSLMKPRAKRPKHRRA